MKLLATRDTWWVTQCEAALLAEGVPMRWERMPFASQVILDVPASEAARASSVLSELLGEELATKRRAGLGPVQVGPLLLQSAFATAVGMAVLTVAFFSVTGSSALGTFWHRQGALISERVWAGEWHRMITAATLHADWSHALGNAGFFLVLAWAATERFGAGLCVLGWLATAVVGFAASLTLSDAALTVGASGGLFGLLGASAGHAVRYRQTGDLLRRGLLRSLGGAVLLLAFTAFSPRANIHAHVAGFVAGILIGLVLPRRPGGSVFQGAAALLCVAAIWAAWAVALYG